MFSPAHRKTLATALAGAALASALAVSGASADPHALDIAAREEAGVPAVPPPPSSIAASAAEEYNDLRSPDAVDASRAAGDPSVIQRGSYPVAEYYGELNTPASSPVADEPTTPDGFDWVSALIGAVAAAGLSLVLMATVGTRLPLRRRTETA
jgi:hypothetical protein